MPSSHSNKNRSKKRKELNNSPPNSPKKQGGTPPNIHIKIRKIDGKLSEVVPPPLYPASVLPLSTPENSFNDSQLTETAEESALAVERTFSQLI